MSAEPAVPLGPWLTPSPQQARAWETPGASLSLPVQTGADETQVRAALCRLAARHEILRTVFRAGGQQRILDRVEAPSPSTELPDPERAPPWTWHPVPGGLRLLASPLVADAATLAILRAELLAELRSERPMGPDRAAPAALAPGPAYADVAAGLVDLATGTRLGGGPGIGHPASTDPPDRALELNLSGVAEAWLRGADAAGRLLAAWLSWLSRASGASSLRVGILCAGRPPELHDAVGPFARVVPVDVPADPRWTPAAAGALLAGAEAEALTVRVAAGARVRWIYAWLGDARRDGTCADRGVTWAAEPCDAALIAGLDAAGPWARLALGAGLPQETASVVASAVLARLVEAAGGDAPVDGGARRWESGAALPDTPPLLAGFWDQAGRRPDAVAVEDARGATTWARLGARVRALAGRLRALGAGPEARIAGYLSRSVDAVVAPLAALEVGAVWAPLDPDDPLERTLERLEELRPLLVLSSPETTDRHPAWSGLLLELSDDDDDSEVERSPPVPDDDRAAYILYTSGSAGRPSGVVVSRCALAARLAGLDAELGLRASDVVLQLLNPCFDAAIPELIGGPVAGARLVIDPLGLRRPPEEALQIAAEASVTVLELTASWWRAALDQLDRGQVQLTPTLRRCVVGGERLYGAELARWAAHAPAGSTLVNAYGPTEACVTATLDRLPLPGDAPLTEDLPVGRPLPETLARVCDPECRPCDVGEVGELHLGGITLARGYLGRPGATAARFRPDPLAAAPGARLYHTGDRARRLPDGRLQILGRLDEERKISGVRVHPAELEAELRAIGGLRDVAVLVHEDGHHAALAAFYVPEGATWSEPAALRARLAERLPRALLPAVLRALPAMPLDSRGKCDLAALRAELRRAPVEVHAAPADALETTTLEAMRLALSSPSLAVDADFFLAGGDSLRATHAAVRLAGALGLRVGAADLFDHPTARALAGALRARHPEALTDPLVALGEPERSPLSCQQLDFWAVQRLLGEEGSTKLSAALSLRGPLDVGLLLASLERLVARHGLLRARVIVEEGRPFLRFDREAVVPFAVVDLSGGTGRLDEALAEAVGAALDLASDPPFRVRLLRLEAHHHVLVVVLHHIVGDGGSLAVLAGELLARYGAGPEALAEPLVSPQFRYTDWIARERALIDGPSGAREIAWWTRRLYPLLREARTRSGDNRAGEMLVETAALGPAELEALRRAASAHRVTAFAVLVAALAPLLGQGTVGVATMVANRGEPGAQDMVGLLANQVVLALDGGEPSALARVAQARARTLEAMAHGLLPHAVLLSVLSDLPGFEAAHLADAMVLVDELSAPPSPPGLDVRPLALTGVERPPGAALSYDVLLSGALGPDGLALKLQRSRMRAFTMEDLLVELRAVVAALLAEAP